MISRSESLHLDAVDWPELPNFLTAEAFQNLPADVSACIIIEGMNFAGRHTQAAAMCEEFGLKKFNFTEWLEKYTPDSDAERDLIQECLRKGCYLPDDLMIKIADWALETFVRQEVSADAFHSRPFVVVGYPRTLAQATHFQLFLKRHHIYATVIVLGVKDIEAQRRMSQASVDRIGHALDARPEIQFVKIGEYYLKTHGFLKWLVVTRKATRLQTCIDKGEYERRKGENLTVEDRGDYVVLSEADVTNRVMKFLNMIHFVQHSGA